MRKVTFLVSVICLLAAFASCKQNEDLLQSNDMYDEAHSSGQALPTEENSMEEIPVNEDVPQSEDMYDGTHEEKYSTDEMITMGRFFDVELINIIGGEEFKQWLSRTPEEERTVYKLIEDYGITNEELLGNIRSSMYEEIMLYWPER